MLMTKEKLIRNHKIVETFCSTYPKEIRVMMHDVRKGIPAPGAPDPVNALILNDGMCDKLKEILDGKMSIDFFMTLWTLANLGVDLGVNLGI